MADVEIKPVITNPTRLGKLIGLKYHKGTYERMYDFKGKPTRMKEKLLIKRLKQLEKGLKKFGIEFEVSADSEIFEK